MPTDIDSPWLTIAEAARYGKRHEDTISAACRNGSLRANQPRRKGKWLIHRDDLDAWIRGEIAPATPAKATRRRAS